jgi:hypothetical protein
MALRSFLRSENGGAPYKSCAAGDDKGLRMVLLSVVWPYKDRSLNLAMGQLRLSMFIP